MKLGGPKGHTVNRHRVPRSQPAGPASDIAVPRVPRPRLLYRIRSPMPQKERKGTLVFFVKHPRKPEENRHIWWKSKENLRKIDTFGGKVRKTSGKPICLGLGRLLVEWRCWASAGRLGSPFTFISHLFAYFS